MITEHEAERAVRYLHEKAGEAARSRAGHEYLEGMTKVLKAKLSRESNGKTVGEREDYALAHDDYQRHLEEVRATAELNYEHQNKRKAATALLDGWRTQEASRRGADRAG